MQHTLIALVEDKPGVLNRVASLFRRRNFNIESLNVGHTENPDISRMTIVMDSAVGDARKVEVNLYKLVNVIDVQDVTNQPSVTRDLALIKVRATPEQRAEVANLAYAEARNGFVLPGIGKLVLVNRKARMGRNPATGETIHIPAKTVVKFRLSKACKDSVMSA